MTHPLVRRLQNSSSSPLLLDAAMGTELSRLGAGTSPPLWSARALMDRPELVLRIHQRAVEAGADILTANTFRTHERNLIQAGFAPAVAREKSLELARQAVALARLAVRRGERECLVAGSLSPLEDCYQPELTPGERELAREHRAQAEHLAEAGADFILIETMNSPTEARFALRAAIQTGLPTAVSFVTDGKGRLLSGDTLTEAVQSLLEEAPAPLAVGVNCIPVRLVLRELHRLRKAFPTLSLLAYANTGRPLDPSGERYSDPISPEDYAAAACGWIAAGARIIGSCCGTDERHTAALRLLG